MAIDPGQALRGAASASPPPRAHGPARVLGSLLVVGAGGTLGSAVLAEALVAGRFQRVAALVDAPLSSAVRGLQPLTLAQLQPAPPAGRTGASDALEAAVIVFERERHANGRDEAFVQPTPKQLGSLAQVLRAAGVRQLMVLVPHTAALLPQALAHGFADHEEREVAALGFEHLVFVRTAQTAPSQPADGLLPRFAAWWLSQLRWMVPQREQPVRAARLARLAVQLMRQLPQAPPGTRVLAPAVLWQASQHEDPDQVLQPWLHGTPPR